MLPRTAWRIWVRSGNDANYTAIVKHEDGWWIGRIEEVPGVNCQESSRDELLSSLREALTEALAFNPREALSATGDR